MDKKETYKRIKIIGLISFIPMVLLAGPLAGYLIADSLHNFFQIKEYIYFIFAIIGIISAIFETSKIIKKVIEIENKK